MSQNNSSISFFDSDLQQDDDSVNYGYNFLTLVPVSLFLIFANSLLIYIIISNRKKAWVKRTKQIHVFYLILCDLIVGFSLIPFIVVRLLRLQKKPYWLCAILIYTSITCQTVSYYHMLAVCVRRFRKLRKIDQPNGNDDYRYGVESLLIWTFVLLTFIPPYTLSGETGCYLTFCQNELMFGPSDKVAVVYLLILFCLPCLLTNVIYVIVIRRMKNRIIAVQPAPPNSTVHFRNCKNTVAQLQSTSNATVSAAVQYPTNNVKGLGQNMTKVNKIIGYLLIVLNISILSPVIMFGMMLGGHQNMPLWIQAFTYINNLSSPFIYSFSIAPLREELKRTLRKCFSCVSYTHR